MGESFNFLGNNLADFWTYTGSANATVGHIVMILIGLFFIYPVSYTHLDVYKRQIQWYQQ